MTSLNSEDTAADTAIASPPQIADATPSPSTEPSKADLPPPYRAVSEEWTAATLPVVRDLFDAMNAQGIRHCHWKSNIRLGETLRGDQDIDLLVDRADLSRLQAIMAQVGFKTTVPRAGLGHPGVFHALAMDAHTGRLADLHCHHDTISGDSLVKTYHFPCVDALLDDTLLLAGARVPRPEVELVMFVVRTILKHTSAIEILKVNRRYHKTVAELAWLREAADPAEVPDTLGRLFPGVDLPLFQQMADATADAPALPARIVLARRLARRLRHMRRLGVIRAMASRAWRLWGWVRGKIAHRGHLHLTSGGAIIALVGPKGTGKSTLSLAVAERLAEHLDVHLIHAGKPPPTILSAAPRLFLPLARRLLPHERLSEYEKPERRRRKSYSLFHVARMTLLAHDRARLLARAFRRAASGALVVSDRFPSPTPGAIDSRTFNDDALDATGSPLKRVLMRWERALYQDMPRPHIVLRLIAPIEVAIARDASRDKLGGPDPAAIARRWDLETMADFPASRVVEVETAGSLDATVARAANAVWEAL